MTLQAARLTPVLCLALLLAGCTGGLDDLGPVQLKAQRDSVERTFANADCPALTLALRSDIAQLKIYDENEKREKLTAPVTMYRTLERVVGPAGAGDIALENFAKTKEHAAALNGKLAQRNCPVIDVDDELRLVEVKDWQPTPN